MAATPPRQARLHWNGDSRQPGVFYRETRIPPQLVKSRQPAADAFPAPLQCCRPRFSMAQNLLLKKSRRDAGPPVAM